MVNLGCQLPTFVLARHTEHQGFLKSTTYLAKIALILQDAPDKMLTFSQLIYRLAPLIREPRKSVEGNIRVCLSSNKCFVKVPMTPGSLDSKKNYWKLDTEQITEKMVRRHFRGILELFPELASKVQTPAPVPEKRPPVCSPEPAAYQAPVKREVKFSSPFSIESILRRDSPNVHKARPSPLSTVPLRAEQQPGFSHRGVKRSLYWDTEEHERPFDRFNPWPVGGSTHHGLGSQRAAKVINKRTSCEPSSFAVYNSGASTSAYLSPPPSSYVTYAAPTLSHGPFRSWV